MTDLFRIILETDSNPAIRRGCLDTVFGQLDDLPPGHTRCYLRKKLT